jgi:hypothetical protein
VNSGLGIWSLVYVDCYRDFNSSYRRYILIVFVHRIVLGVVIAAEIVQNCNYDSRKSFIVVWAGEFELAKQIEK